MHEDEEHQGSLFGGEALSPPPPATRRAEPPRELVAPDEAGEIRVSRGSATPLAGPTLDDVVTHAWEALVAAVPAACPVCHGEIEPVLGRGLQGRCGTCGVTLD
jgi:hypothetical protein